MKIFCIVIIVLFLKSSYAQQRLFTLDSTIVAVVPGRGIFINGINLSNSNSNIPRWLYCSVKDSNNNIWANGFDGVQYLGLCKFSNKQKFNNYNLLNYGLSSNYLQKITVSKNYIYLLSLNQVFRIDIQTGTARKINSPEVDKGVSDIKCLNNVLFAVSTNNIYKHNDVTDKWIKLSNINLTLVRPHIFELTKDILKFESRNNIYYYNIKSQEIDKVYYNNLLSIVSSSEIINHNGIYYFPSTNGTLIFDGNSLGIIKNLNAESLQFTKNDAFILVNDSVKTIEVKTHRVKYKIATLFEKSVLNAYLLSGEKSNDLYAWKIGNAPWTNYSHENRASFQFSSFGKIPILSKIFHSDRSVEFLEKNILVVYHFNSIVLFVLLIILFLVTGYLLFIKRLFLLLSIFLIYPFFLIAYYLLLHNYIIVENIQNLNLMYLVIFCLYVLISIYESYQLEKNAEPIEKIQRITHGSFGYNNLSRIERLLNNKSAFSVQLEFQNSFKSSLQKYNQITYPLLNSLVKSAPISWQNIVPLLKLDYNSKILFWRVNLYKQLEIQSLKRAYKSNLLLKVKSLLNIISYLRKYHYTKVSCTPQNAILEVVQGLSAKLNSENIKLILNLPDAKKTILCRYSDLQIILDSIINNAIEALESKSDEKEIVITANDKLLKFEIVIENNGPTVQKKLIEKLFRPAASTKSRGGYGLYEAQLLVNKYLGHIEYEESENGNPRFKIILRTLYEETDMHN